ncbi:MAG: M20/M25/M40 family metallo-hydrolase [Bacteroidetes bacterium]|nr:M20/M25/M40 family metallo-hydrolase [Bacteroidota bacterium]
MRLILTGFLFIASSSRAQIDSAFFRKVFNEALENGQAYARLGELCKTIGSRLSGSPQAEMAVAWGKQMLFGYGFDSVYTQPVMVPRWERSKTESLVFSSSVFNTAIKGEKLQDYNCESFEELPLKPSKQHRIPAVALGGSVGTFGKLQAGLVSIHNDAQLDSLGKAGALKGKMVLLNRPFPETTLNTFKSYGVCVGQRVNGASKAAAHGAVAVLVRSMSNRCDLHAHTGVMIYDDKQRKIPTMAVATAVANLLDRLSQQDPNLRINMQLGCQTLPDVPSANVVAETRGSQYPQSIIAFGGHFDSWDQGEGAHDDGAGCMHAFEALRLLKTIGYTPRHTLRCVWWMNEENGLRGATEYAAIAGKMNEKHVAALESDRGGFTPRGFGVDSAFLPKVLKYKTLLDAYGIGEIEKGGGGADIGPISKNNPNAVLVGFIPDSQRYFDVHHSETDVFESVNKRELHLGAASVAVMIVILDQELN